MKMKKHTKPPNKDNVAKKMHKKLKKEQRDTHKLLDTAHMTLPEPEPSISITSIDPDAPRKKKRRDKKKKTKSADIQRTSENSTQNGLLESERSPKNAKSTSHKEELTQLIKQDPELRKFLQEEDHDLLEFDESDVDLSDEDSAIVSDLGEDHEINEVENDEQKPTEHPTFKIKTNALGEKVVDKSLLKSLDEVFAEENPSRKSLAKSIKILVKAFRSCVARIGGNVDETTEIAVKDEKIFDAVVRMCFINLGRGFLSVLSPLKEDKKSEEQKKSSMQKNSSSNPPYKYWAVHRPLVKDYLHSILAFLNELQTDSVVISTVRALLDLIPLYIHFPKMAKNLIKVLVKVWSRKPENCKCLAFIALCRLARLDRKLYPLVYKSCYVAYISNSKIVSEETRPLIAFMHRSFAELTMMDPAQAYQYAFVYIRQFAIHLRNAMIANRKDLIKTVYNWQFINGLHLWVEMLVVASERNQFQGTSVWLKELIYPIIQVIMGTMKVFPISKYLPLKFHCIRLLLMLQTKCDVFIPTLSLSAELLHDLVEIDLKKPSFGKGAVKLIDLKDLLKLSKEMLADAGYRQQAAQGIYQLCQDSAAILEWANCPFSDYAPMIKLFKKFFDACKNRDHKSLFHSLFQKLKDAKKQREKRNYKPLLNLNEDDEKALDAEIDETLDHVEELTRRNGSAHHHIMNKAKQKWKDVHEKPQNQSKKEWNQKNRKRPFGKDQRFQEPGKRQNAKKFKRSNNFIS